MHHSPDTKVQCAPDGASIAPYETGAYRTRWHTIPYPPPARRFSPTRFIRRDEDHAHINRFRAADKRYSLGRHSTYMGTDVSEELKQFVAEQLSVSLERLSAETRLLQDLGVDGEDGTEFITAFSERFGVELTDFDSSLYFGPEAGPNPLVWLWWLLTFQWPRFTPISLSDLQASIHKGRWE